MPLLQHVTLMLLSGHAFAQFAYGLGRLLADCVESLRKCRDLLLEAHKLQVESLDLLLRHRGLDSYLLGVVWVTKFRYHVNKIVVGMTGAAACILTKLTYHA